MIIRFHVESYSFDQFSSLHCAYPQEKLINFMRKEQMLNYLVLTFLFIHLDTIK